MRTISAILLFFDFNAKPSSIVTTLFDAADLVDVGLAAFFFVSFLLEEACISFDFSFIDLNISDAVISFLLSCVLVAINIAGARGVMNESTTQSVESAIDATVMSGSCFSISDTLRTISFVELRPPSPHGTVTQTVDRCNIDLLASA